MTSEYEPNEKETNACVIGLGEVLGHVRHIRNRVDDILARLKDNYHVLRDILDSTSENGVTEHDLYNAFDERD